MAYPTSTIGRMSSFTTTLRRGLAVVCTAALSFGLTACGSKNDAAPSSSATGNNCVSLASVDTNLTKVDGICATGDLGQEPQISFKSQPFDVHNDTYSVLQIGDGNTVQEGDQVCLQNKFVNTDDASVLSSSWNADPADCATISSDTMQDDYLHFFVGQTVHTTIALGYNLDETDSEDSATSSDSASSDSASSDSSTDASSDSSSADTTASNSADRQDSASPVTLAEALQSADYTAQTVDDETSTDSATSSSADSSTDSATSSGSSATQTHYLWVFTIMSATASSDSTNSASSTPSVSSTRATGEQVTDLPSGLPTVTLDDATGKPSIDVSTYTDHGDQLVAQPLIKGSGDTVQDGQSVTVNYTGWLTDGTQFDSSWDNGSPATFSLNQVVTGFKNGLVGQTVGSQVLLIVPPDQGYGSQAVSSIPANSTLIFVVDILAAS